MVTIIGAKFGGPDTPPPGQRAGGSLGATPEYQLQWCSRNSNSHFARNLLLIGGVAIRGTKFTLNAGLGTENKLLIHQLLLGEHYCICQIIFG